MDVPPQSGGKRVRVMIDATVLFAGIGWPRWSYEILQSALRGDFDLVLSPLVIEQARRNLAKKFPDWLEPFEDWLRLCPFEMVQDPTSDQVVNNLDLMRQEEDVPVALAAIQAHPDYFVSDDKDFTEVSPTTEEIHKHLRIVRPVIFLREVMGWSHEELESARHRHWATE
jgi:predicted nucleic acid-binding protein